MGRKIYLVWSDDTYHHYLEGVFATPERAIAYAQTKNDGPRHEYANWRATWQLLDVGRGSWDDEGGILWSSRQEEES